MADNFDECFFFQTKGLKNHLHQETEALILESDDRKLSQLLVNELSNRLRDIEGIIKSQHNMNDEDPVKLRIALE